MADMLQYKCPCCGGAISFDPNLQKMKCPYCDTEFDAESLASYDDALKQTNPDDNMTWQSSPGSDWEQGEENSLLSYVCKSCGGEIVADENTAATSCPYCGNPVVVSGKLSGTLRPDYVIPFKLDKKAAKQGLEEHLKGKRLLPKVFKDQNHIDEIKGIYVPFWLFDADSFGSVRYKGTKVHTWSDSTYNYTQTNFYSIIREGSVSFVHVPVDGASKIEDDLMESIEPFDFSEAVDFQTAYLAGYFADKYDVDAQSSIERANTRIKKSTEEAFATTVLGYSTLSTEDSSINLANSGAKYALYPVWLLNTTWNGGKYTFAMNGQTGKFVGDLPLDKGAYYRWLGGIAAAIGAVGTAICWLLFH